MQTSVYIRDIRFQTVRWNYLNIFDKKHDPRIDETWFIQWYFYILIWKIIPWHGFLPEKDVKPLIVTTFHIMVNFGWSSGINELISSNFLWDLISGNLNPKQISEINNTSCKVIETYFSIHSISTVLWYVNVINRKTMILIGVFLIYLY